MVKEFKSADGRSITIKDSFISRYEKLTDIHEFIQTSLSFLRRSIRVNTLKIDKESLIKRMSPRFSFESVPWCEDCFWIEHKEGRRDIGNTIEHTLGYIYIQEAASTIPALVLNPEPGEAVLDMCAAPGSKTTQMAAMMKNRGVIVANDFKMSRLKALSMNVQRMNAFNTIISLNTGWRIKGRFDKILVDAPCSATGAIRKSFNTLRIWNPLMISRLAHTQKKLVDAAYSLLKKGGTLVYSTCSLEPEEDEGVVDFLISKYEDLRVEDITLKIKRSPPLLEFGGLSYSSEVGRALRIWPQDNDTEGFFVAKIKKV